MSKNQNRFIRFTLAALGALSILFASHAPAFAQTRGGSAPAASEAGPMVDIQTASASELETLPGVGPARAQAIIEYRTRTPFRRVEDLLRVEGIGRATFRDLRARITVGGVRAAADSAE